MSVDVAPPESDSIRNSSGRETLRRLVPFPLRVEVARLRRWPSWRLERSQMALAKGELDSLTSWPPVFEYRSPLRRSQVSDEALQQGKEVNVALAAQAIDRIVIEPGQVFSYHHAVGRPTRLRGFRKGLELHGGAMQSGVGGGCCQVSNLLYWLALNAGMEIVERHRHALDLFPDHGRTVPFGCGATVFFNLSDLRFRNPHSVRVCTRLAVRDGFLVGSVAAESPLDQRFEVYETGHRFRREEMAWVRENQIWRRRFGPDDELLGEEPIASNFGRCLYDPEAPPE